MPLHGASFAPRLGRYTLESHLARGGMAEIYLARVQGAASPVVVKVITRDLADERKFIQMFLDEARVVAGLNHPNIARLLEVGKDGHTYFLAMEYVDGETVRALLERSARTRAPIPLGIALGIVARVADALHHAHERKNLSGAPLDIVHRDVTPANVMIGRDGVVKLLDFGIARAKGRAQETQSGTVKGKFAYMAPEQCMGKAVDRRADVFALGIMLYELTTLRRAFRAASDYATLQKIIHLDLPPPSSLVHNYPPALEAIITRAMALDPSERFQTAAELIEALEQFAARFGGLAGPREIAAFLSERFRDPAPDGEPEEVEIEPVTVSVRAPRATGTPPSSPQPTPPVDDAASTHRMARASEPPPATGAAQMKTMLGLGILDTRRRTGATVLPPPPVVHPITEPVAVVKPGSAPWAMPVAIAALVTVALAIFAIVLLA